DREEQQREGDAHAEEDRQRLFAAVAGLHKAKAQRAHLLRRTRHALAEPLEHPDQRLEARLLVFLAAERQLLQAAVDGVSARRDQGIRDRRDQPGPEEKREKRNHRGHRYTSILTTCLIQT